MSAAGAPGSWFVLALAAIFVALGILFVAAPRAGAALFGIPAPEGPGLLYLTAIGLRDLAFGLYIALLNRLVPRRILGLVFAATIIIPAGDVAIVWAVRGLDSPGHLLLHGLSGLVMAGTAFWLIRQPPDRKDEPA